MKHLSGVVESLEEDLKKVQEGGQELRTDFKEEIEKLRKNGKSDQAETFKILDTLLHNKDIDKLQQDLIQTQHEVSDLSGLKAQIVSLANPLEKMEVALKHLSGVVELVEDEVRKEDGGHPETSQRRRGVG